MINYKIGMANYKPISSSSSPITTEIYEDLDMVSPAASSSADTFGTWVQFSADIGTGKALYGISTNPDNTSQGGKGTVIEIAEGASSSEVVIIRLNLADFKNSTTDPIPLYKVLTNNARIAIRAKDGEAVANVYASNLWIGPKK